MPYDTVMVMAGRMRGSGRVASRPNHRRRNPMDTSSLYEVVFVIDAEHLIDSESYQRRYRTERPLVPGCYLVHWAAQQDAPRYDEAAEFLGPYVSRRVAERAARDTVAATWREH
jgi:hypothetical protein